MTIKERLDQIDSLLFELEHSNEMPVDVVTSIGYAREYIQQAIDDCNQDLA